MNKDIFYIGVIGSRPSNIGGYDKFNEHRLKIKENLEYILSKYNLDSYKVVMGLLGPDTGFDEDFWEFCRSKKLDYKLVIPFEQYEDYISDFGKNTLEHKKEKAFNTIILNEGKFTPKKIINYYNFMYENSNVLFIVKDVFNSFLPKHILESEKTHLLNV